MSELKKDFKIIYIIGTGRNGSTLLDIVLGNSCKIQSTGELFNTIGAWQINKICSCNRTVNDCPFWSKVKQSFKNTSTDLELKDILSIQKSFERSMLSPLYLIFNKFFRTKKFKKYKQFLKKFYAAIASVSEKPVLVDSSKNFFRGYALLETFPDNIYYVHLVRDGRGQMWSWIKGGVIPPFNIPTRKTVSKTEYTNQHFWWVPILYAFSWVLYNLGSFLVISLTRRDRSIRVQYEDFTDNPSFYIRCIGSLVNEDLHDLDNHVKKKNPVLINHILAGSRHRNAKQIIIRQSDNEWQRLLPQKNKIIFWLIAGWLARLYGYSLKF
jgi:Sulfotransferase family